jgi:hypothetical protein
MTTVLNVLRRAAFGLALAVAVGGFGMTRWVIEHHRVITSGDAALVNLWTMGAPSGGAGGKAVKPTAEQFGGGWFLLAVGAGRAGALALPGRRRCGCACGPGSGAQAAGR